MVYNLSQVRQVCANAIRKCAQAERQAMQLQEAAARQRQAALTDARQKHAQARQQAEALLKEVRSLAQQGDRILADTSVTLSTTLRARLSTSLSLTPGSSTPFAIPSGAGLNELARLLQNQRGQARDALTRLKATAEALKEEQRKWWKFW